jgi:serine/threonine-protein kinase
MARVHLARREPYDFMDYAAKRMLPEYAARPRFARMFWVEASICMMLQHPNIVRAVDFGAQDGEIVLLLEYVDGVSCAQLLRAASARGEGIPLGAALFMATEVLRALAYAHDAVGPTGRPLGIVHRDVSPGNILVSEQGTVKLTDFGVARSNDRAEETHPGTLKGKFGYMSPEQIAGAEVDRRTDVFSLGVVLFELVTGTPLFTGCSDFQVLTRTFEADLAPLAEPRPGLPLELRLILANALARDPEERFQSAGEFLSALEAFARHAGIQLVSSTLRDWLSVVGVLPHRSGTFHAVCPPEEQPDAARGDGATHPRDGGPDEPETPDRRAAETVRPRCRAG